METMGDETGCNPGGVKGWCWSKCECVAAGSPKSLLDLDPSVALLNSKEDPNINDRYALKSV